HRRPLLRRPVDLGSLEHAMARGFECRARHRHLRRGGNRVRAHRVQTGAPADGVRAGAGGLAVALCLSLHRVRGTAGGCAHAPTRRGALVAACSDNNVNGPPSVDLNLSRIAGFDPLKAALVAARKQDNGGFNLDMWAAVVDRNGLVVAVVFTGATATDQWPGSRVIAA